MIHSGIKYQETVTLITETCCSCGVAFGIPSNLMGALRADSDKWFYCPNGHRQHYSKSTEDILKEKFEKDKSEKDKYISTLRDELCNEINRRADLERKLKRTHNGVCTCCNRSFVNLKRHMETKHPELASKKKKAKV
jgi:hypothetical protein